MLLSKKPSPKQDSLDSPDCSIAGIRIHNLTEHETIEKISELLADGGAHYMAVVNAAKIVAATQDKELLRILQHADIVTADGMSVVWASRFLGKPLKERVTGIDTFARLVEYAAEHNVSVYFFGAQEESVRKIVEEFLSRYPKLRIAGYRNGYFTAAENEVIVSEIKRSGAGLLFVAMGSPAQERWIAANLKVTGVKFALGVGGSFDHLSGRVRRAPLWMQRMGLEWLHRLALEPRRLWRRYLLGNSRFIYLIIRQKRQKPDRQGGC
jgi:N-acetylglucosaminyldiphosphoundecaprenol N-acetyl-beta-D-mannosaminyltransferase